MITQRLSRPLRHPNTMSTAVRLALPDPACPIDEPVKPAMHSFSQSLNQYWLPDHQVNAQQQPAANNQAIHHIDMGAGLSYDQPFNIDKFIHEQSQVSQNQPSQWRLPLALLPKLVKAATPNWWRQYMTHNPIKLNQQVLGELEAQLYMMGQMYQIMLCVFLLCQCKSRKTLNPQITLLDLTQAINDYVKAHRNELAFLTPHPIDTLIIEPIHVELAAVAMHWQVSKHTDIVQRTTTISSSNPLITP